MSNQVLPPTLASALNLVNSQLFSFTADPQFHEKLTLAFGEGINSEFYRPLWANPSFNLGNIVIKKKQIEFLL
ncbi:hypothetical protein [Geminocystis sp. GBBB08]|uniref:hypothetical protein n=1 Tax=Geminocystis sp. GBBB08 TaxID=2604140 RepID=UPI0027E34EFF|nr:hypothetical protein [Geminocystis sp. GBBB08]MBL1211092.1 hypothetical protein [Geminocystis sp. GBBB08]